MAYYEFTTSFHVYPIRPLAGTRDVTRGPRLPREPRLPAGPEPNHPRDRGVIIALASLTVAGVGLVALFLGGPPPL